MWKQLSGQLHKFSTGWLTLCALVIFLLFMALVLPDQSAKAEKIAGEAGSPDTSLFYTANDLYRMAEAYGPDGRAAYIRARFTFDAVFPLVYTFFLVTAISWLCRRAFPADSRWRQANPVPLLGMLFDYLENFSAALVIGRYPSPTPVVDFLAPVFTLVKWIFVGGSFVLLVVVALAAAWRWFTASRRLGRPGKAT